MLRVVCGSQRNEILISHVCQQGHESFCTHVIVQMQNGGLSQ